MNCNFIFNTKSFLQWSYSEYREMAKGFGKLFHAFQHGDEERTEAFERAWQCGRNDVASYRMAFIKPLDIGSRSTASRMMRDIYNKFDHYNFTFAGMENGYPKLKYEFTNLADYGMAGRSQDETAPNIDELRNTGFVTATPLWRKLMKSADGFSLFGKPVLVISCEEVPHKYNLLKIRSRSLGNPYSMVVSYVVLHSRMGTAKLCRDPELAVELYEIEAVERVSESLGI